MILQDPAVESLSSFIGADGTNTTLNSGRMSINLKPLIGARPERVRCDSPAAAEAGEGGGHQLYMQPVQDITVDDRVSRTQYQYTLEDPDSNELNEWTNKFVDEAEATAGAGGCGDRPADGRLAVSLVIDRVTASRLGIAPATIDNTLYDAFGQRQINTMYTQLNQYHVILEAQPQFQLDPDKLNNIYMQANASSGTIGAGRGVYVCIVGVDVGGLECD